ncbi:hypothetical protein SGRIM128S_00011 [Streptomyces griseomycini]
MRQSAQRGEERAGARDLDDALGVRRLLGEHARVVRVVLLHRPVRQQQRHRRVPLAPVHDLHDLVPVEPVPVGPAAPDAFDRGVGVDEGAVHVQQEGAGGEYGGGRHRQLQDAEEGARAGTRGAVGRGARGVPGAVPGGARRPRPPVRENGRGPLCSSTVQNKPGIPPPPSPTVHRDFGSPSPPRARAEGRHPATASHRLHTPRPSINSAAICVISRSGTRFISAFPPTMPSPATAHSASTAPRPTESGSS